MTRSPSTCDHCGRSTPVAELRQVRRAGGCRLWVCIHCTPAGTVEVADLEALRDLAAMPHAGTARPVEPFPPTLWSSNR